MLSSYDKPTIVPIFMKKILRIDILGGYLHGIKEPGSSQLAFSLLSCVAEVMMTISYSNADERGTKKTPNSSLPELEGILSSLILIKIHISNPFTGNHQMLCKKKLKGRQVSTTNSTRSETCN